MRNKTFGLFSLTFGLFLTFLTAACGRDEIPSLPAPPENDSTHQETDRPSIPAGAQTFSYTDPALWQGDTAHFRWGTAPDGYPTLTLDAPQAGISYLSAPSAVYLRGARWDLRFQINGKTPGRKSHARFYLASDRADLRQPLHGYFLALGICNPSLTGDPSGQYLALCRQDGLPEDTTVIFDCHSEMFLTGYSMLRLRVCCDTRGEWELLANIENNPQLRSWGKAVDTTYTRSACLGIFCEYSRTDARNYVFGDLRVQAIPQAGHSPVAQRRRPDWM